MEELRQLRPEYGAWNNASVWNWQFVKKQNTEIEWFNFFRIVYDTEEEKIQPILNQGN
jgi:hypothetical protein